MTEIDKLKARLEELGVSVRGISPGSNPNVTPEQVAKAIRETLDDPMLDAFFGGKPRVKL